LHDPPNYPLGELLKGRRDRFVLATKFTNQTDPGDPKSAGNHRKKIVASIEASLRRLKTDRIDLYWVRARDVLTGVEELMRALDDQVRHGKILYPAVSDWAAWEIASPTPTPTISSISTEINLLVFCSVLDSVLKVHDENIGHILVLSDQRLEWHEGATSAADGGRGERCGAVSRVSIARS
jgi:aryl-alcohol dehydrogenase-like predicted oxidoreductase